MADTQNMDLVYVSFIAEINATTSEGLLNACTTLSNKGTKTIYLLLDTPGGQVDNGIAVYNVLRALPAKLITHNVGSVNSIGNVVFLAGEERYANPGATFMFHGVGAIAKKDMRLEERNLIEQLDNVRAGQKKIGRIIEERGSFSDGKEIEDLFLQAATKDAQYAKDRGIIHEIREAKVPSGVPILQLVFKR